MNMLNKPQLEAASLYCVRCCSKLQKKNETTAQSGACVSCFATPCTSDNLRDDGVCTTRLVLCRRIFQAATMRCCTRARAYQEEDCRLGRCCLRGRLWRLHSPCRRGSGPGPGGPRGRLLRRGSRPLCAGLVCWLSCCQGFRNVRRVMAPAHPHIPVHATQKQGRPPL